MNKICKLLLPLASISLFAVNTFAADADQRYFYIGAEAGAAIPVKDNFIHPESKTAITLKQSAMYSGKIGYSFYPQMALEFSYTYQPCYGLNYLLPTSPKKLPGSTKVLSNIYMMNLVYDFMPIGDKIIPFVILGAGIAQIKVKAADVKHPLLGMKIFKINKSDIKHFAWQAGLGVSTAITDNFSVDMAAKLQVVQDIKIKYKRFIPEIGKLQHQTPIKKTLGVTELGVGFTYKIPIRR